MGYGYYPRYVSVAEKRAKAEKKIRQLRRKDPDIRPVILQGQALATTWWGRAWNRNLEGYADYSNRIGRGRSYVRHMAVLDLRISPGRVDALVQGTRARPYGVQVRIAKIRTKNWQAIRKKCQQELTSLPDLLAGRFPEQLKDVFLVQGQGLFPAPSEISFDCSCPDWASMCKHVAATLYGVGARLDEDPALFFTLRKADMEELVSQAVQGRADAIIAETMPAGERVIADDRLAGLFGIDLDDFDAGSGKKTEKAATSAGKAGKQGKPTAGKHQQDPARESPADDPVLLPTGYGAVTDLVLGCIEESGAEGISVRDLAEIIGIPAKKLYPTVYRLKKQDRIASPGRGIYVSVHQRPGKSSRG